jgi:leucyl aminopeptidase
MPLSITTRSGDPADTSADTRVVPFFEGEDLPGPLAALAESGEAKPGLRKTAVFHEDGKRVIVAGLGKREEFDAEKARVAGAAVLGRARELGSRSLSWPVPAPELTGALVEGTVLALYRFDRFKSNPDENGALESLELVGDGDLGDQAQRSYVIGGAQNRARDLQNLPSNELTPGQLGDRAAELVAAHDSLSFELFGREEIADMGMGAFSAVARGSHVEPQLIVIRHKGSGDGPLLGFVGKAVTFDSGGISIKPGAKMSEMKFDMSGGAAVVEAMGAIGELGLPANVLAVVPSTENMPSGHAIKPGDIVRAMNGKTIEINNTDAEGRLILADALCYAVEHGAERIVDLATLTGAIITALGNTYAGLFSNDDDWCAEVQAACDATGEIAWRFPFHPEYSEMIKGRYADLDNAPEARKASSILGADFLRNFVGDTPWAHLDIAGVAWGMNRNYVGSGASGWGVRTLVELATGY